MKVGLFIPCYVDQLYPQVGIATLKLLRSLGVSVDFPIEQTCCGQPMANTGCAKDAAGTARKFLEDFAGYDAIVAPSGSCVSMVRNHYKDLVGDHPNYDHVSSNTYELCEFLVDVLKVESIDAAFPHKVGLHQSCHGLRELRLASSSEIVHSSFSKVRVLLESVREIEVMNLNRPDECCGFGGTFAVAEEAVSCAMGRDRVADHQNSGVEVMTGVDMSCLMHMDGLIQRNGVPIRVLHISEILTAGQS